LTFIVALSTLFRTTVLIYMHVLYCILLLKLLLVCTVFRVCIPDDTSRLLFPAVPVGVGVAVGAVVLVVTIIVVICYCRRGNNRRRLNSWSALTSFNCVILLNFIIIIGVFIKSFSSPLWADGLLLFISVRFYGAMLCRARLSLYVVCPSVRRSVCEFRNHIGWNTLKIISQLISLSFMLGRSDPMRTPPTLGWNKGRVQKTCNISETVQDRTNVTMTY